MCAGGWFSLTPPVGSSAGDCIAPAGGFLAVSSQASKPEPGESVELAQTLFMFSNVGSYFVFHVQAFNLARPW